jgi:hypothetical protein
VHDPPTSLIVKVLILLLHASLLFLAKIKYGEYICFDAFEAKNVWGFCDFLTYQLNPFVWVFDVFLG